MADGVRMVLIAGAKREGVKRSAFPLVRPHLFYNKPFPSSSILSPFRLALFLLPVFVGGVLQAASSERLPDLSPLKSWMAAQKNIRSLSADFMQTRALRTLRSPLRSQGRLWFRAPDQFRWELGDPPKTIIIGTADGITVIHPEKMRAERKPLASPGSPAGFVEALGMIRLPQGGSLEEFQRRIQVLAITTSGATCHLEMLPRDASARRLSAIKLAFDTRTGHWISFEIVTREGTSILNEFHNVKINIGIDKEIFDFDLTGYKVTDEQD